MIAIGATLGVALLLAVAFTTMPASWLAWRYYRPCTGRWAEAKRAGCATHRPDTRRPRVLQPINTWTNLAYPLAGWATADPAFAVVMTGLGINSALYHGTSTSWAGRLDVASMYVSLVFLLLAPFMPGFDALVLAIAIGMALSAWFLSDLLWKIGGLFAVAVGVTAVRLHPLAVQGPWFWLALFLFGGGFIAWQIDQRDRFPAAAAHGVWHVMTAAGYSCLRIAQLGAGGGVA